MDKTSVARYTVLVIAVLNSVANLLGYQTISDDLTNDIVAVISGGIFLWAGWKNNYLSRKGRKQKRVLAENNLD